MLREFKRIVWLPVQVVGSDQVSQALSSEITKTSNHGNYTSPLSNLTHCCPLLTVEFSKFVSSLIQKSCSTFGRDSCMVHYEPHIQKGTKLDAIMHSNKTGALSTTWRGTIPSSNILNVLVFPLTVTAKESGDPFHMLLALQQPQGLFHRAASAQQSLGYTLMQEIISSQV